MTTTERTTTIPALPPRPAQPAALRALIQHANDRAAAGKRALLAGDFVTYTRSVSESLRFDAEIRGWYATPEGAAYARAAEEYNTALAARQAWRERQAQAARNAAAVAQVRSSACGQCFASHPGEC